MEVVDIDSNCFEAYPSLHESQPKHYYDSKEFNEMYVKFSDTKNNLKFLNLNSDTLVSYMDTLRVNFNIICITEPWQNVKSLSPIYSQNYKLFGSFRANSIKGRGAMNILTQILYTETQRNKLQRNKHFNANTVHRNTEK